MRFCELLYLRQMRPAYTVRGMRRTDSGHQIILQRKLRFYKPEPPVKTIGITVRGVKQRFACPQPEMHVMRGAHDAVLKIIHVKRSRRTGQHKLGHAQTA